MPDENIRQEKDRATSGFGAGLRAIINERGITQSQLSDMSGVTQGTISKIIGGKHEPTQEIKQKIADSLKVDVNIIAINEESLFKSRFLKSNLVTSHVQSNIQQLQQPTIHKQSTHIRGVSNRIEGGTNIVFSKQDYISIMKELLNDKYIVNTLLPEIGYTEIPIVEAVGSMGPGSLENSKKVRGTLAFRSDWLRSKGPVNSMIIIRAIGDSMHPTIPDRAMVLVDESRKDIISNRIYFFRYSEELYIKRIIKDSIKTPLDESKDDEQDNLIDVDVYRLISDQNKKDKIVDQDDPDFEVIGECIWTGHDLP